MTAGAHAVRRFLRIYPHIAAAVAVCVGLVTLVGWLAELPSLQTLATPLPSMTATTALVTVLAGIALGASVRATFASWLRRAARICAFIVVAIASVILIEYVAGSELDLDRLLGPLGMAWPADRPAPQTAVAYGALGASVLALGRDVHRRVADYLALAAITIATAALFGYLFGVPSMYEVPRLPHLGTSVSTAVVLMGLGFGVLAVRGERRVIAVVAADDAGGEAARLLFGGLLAYPVVAVAIIAGARMHWYTLSFASALVLLIALAYGSGVILSTANRLSRVDAALRGTEARARVLIDHASDAIFLADLDGRYTDVNEAACRMLGFERSELVGMTIVDLIPPEDRPRLATSKAHMEEGVTDVGEWMLRRKDGSYLPVEVSAKIFPDGRWQGIVRDVSERKRAEAALAGAAQAERALRSELESLMAAITEAVGESPRSDVQTVLRAIADRGRVLTGAASAAIGIGGTPGGDFDRWVVVGMPDDVAEVLGRPPHAVGVLGEVMRRGEAIRMPNVSRHPAFRGFPTNHPMIASLLAVPIKHHDRAVGTLYLANKRDAPEFSEADERAVLALAERAGAAVETATRFASETTLRTWLQSIVDQLPEAVIVFDADRRVKAMNRAALALARPAETPATLGALDVHDLSGASVPFDIQPLARALEHGETVRERELAIRRPDGQMVPIMASAGPVRDEAGLITGAIVVLTEISERKELERQRDEWVAVVAHDLRQPLNTILLWSDRLEALATDDKQRSAIERIRDAAWRLNRMVQDLLDAARIAATRLSIEPCAADIVETVRAAVDNMRAAHPGAGFQMSSPDRELAWFDRDRVEQVLANLLSNAVKYGTPGAPIRVEVASTDPAVEVAVINEGPAIPDEERARLFARFARTQHARAARIPGIGLGLYICKGLIEAQGGRIWMDGRDGKNAFRFTLPRPPE